MAFKPESFEEWLERTTKEVARRVRMKADLKPARHPKPKTRAKAKPAAARAPLARVAQQAEQEPAQKTLASVEELRAAPGSVYQRAQARAAASAASPPG